MALSTSAWIDLEALMRRHNEILVLALLAGTLAACASMPKAGVTGRWNGVRGPDQIREVLMLDSVTRGTFSGTSFFETQDGEALAGGRGTVDGRIIDGRVEFKLSRDGMMFDWSGRFDERGRTLSGKFAGYSNDATYVRQIDASARRGSFNWL